jgi:serine/threonine protein kinase
VLDFGIVKEQPSAGGHGAAGSTLLTSPNLVQGTPAFMAPEMVFDERPIDGRTDLYSLACTAYWALTGELVFKASTPAQMLLHHAQTQPRIAVRRLGTASSGRAGSAADAVSREEIQPGGRLRRSPSKAQLARIRCADPWTRIGPGRGGKAHAPDVVATTSGTSYP